MAELSAYRGQWLVVTGGADGIGLALARAFGDQGLKAALIDIRKERAEEAAGELQAAGIEALGFGADVSDRASIGAAADELASQGIIPRLLWINAGVAAGASVLNAPQNAVEWTFDVNVLGAMWTAQAFVPRMIAQGGPAHVGITASSAAYAPPAAPFTLYSISKHATMAVGEALMAELAPQGIGVTIFSPGVLNTTIWDGAKARPERFGGIRHRPHESGERWRAAPSPADTMPYVLDCVARGGGYCGVFTERVALERHEARSRAMRDSIRLLED